MTRLFSIALLASALLFGGCLTIPDATFQCASDSDCPDDFGCQADNLCYKLDGGGDGGGGGEWTCRSGEVIQFRRLCDGVTQCADGSDEAKCGMRECKDGSRTLRTAQFCDDRQDCEDGSDEADCDPVSCVDTGNSATDTKVPFAWLCDGDIDCPEYPSGNPGHHVDETECLSCDNLTERYHMYAACDHNVDCSDGSDEAECFLCNDGNAEGEKRHRVVICDGISQCSNGADEASCADFACGEESIPGAYVCDGSPDCCAGLFCTIGVPISSADDEQGCDLPVVEPAYEGAWPKTHSCGGSTLQAWALCQGVAECADGSDEMRPNCPFLCNDGSRIPREWVCNGRDDCPDGEDEGGAHTQGLCED